MYGEGMSKGYIPVRQDPRKMRYIEWLTTPMSERTPSNEIELAAELDVYPKTLYNWRHEREFKDVWSEETETVGLSEDKRANIINNLYEVGMDKTNPRMVMAAKEFLNYYKELRPERDGEDPTAGKALNMLSDEELDALLAEGARAHMGVQDGPNPE